MVPTVATRLRGCSPQRSTRIFHLRSLQFVCMYICMYVCMYVCVFVYVCVCMYGCMYVCTYVCVCVCMYVKGWAMKSGPCTATFNDLLCFPF
jgi:hypothetical protein